MDMNEYLLKKMADEVDLNEIIGAEVKEILSPMIRESVKEQAKGIINELIRSEVVALMEGDILICDGWGCGENMTFREFFLKHLRECSRSNWELRDIAKKSIDRMIADLMREEIDGVLKKCAETLSADLLAIGKKTQK